MSELAVRQGPSESSPDAIFAAAIKRDPELQRFIVSKKGTGCRCWLVTTGLAIILTVLAAIWWFFIYEKVEVISIPKIVSYFFYNKVKYNKNSSMTSG